MVKVEKSTITMTRGDTLRIALELTKNGEPFTPGAGDKIRFAMKRKITDAECIIKKEISDLSLEISPDETKSLDYGTYVYDMEITYEDGAVDTFIAGGRLSLTEEVE